jgi:nicotinamidase-related amidase
MMKKFFEDFLLFFSIKERQESKPKIAVLLIDMQDCFVSYLRKGEKERIVPNQIEVIRKCQKNNIPIVVFELVPEKYGHTINELISVLKENGERIKIIQKEHNCCFYETSLDMYLQSIGIKKLLLMGINADCCVKETAESAKNLGYQIVTSNSLISGQTHHSHNNNANWYIKNGLFLRISDLQKYLEK